MNLIQFNRIFVLTDNCSSALWFCCLNYFKWSFVDWCHVLFTSLRSASRTNTMLLMVSHIAQMVFFLFFGPIFTLELFFFAHDTRVVLSNSIKQTASKSANNFSSYKGTYKHTYIHYCFIKG